MPRASLASSLAPEVGRNPMMCLQRTGHPSLYEINTRIWLEEFRQRARTETCTLAHIPDSALDRMAELHFDLIWLMGVWQTGQHGETIARRDPALQSEYQKVLPDLSSRDIRSSPYAVQNYCVSADLGGPQALAELRRRLAGRGIGLILDFVPNHTARDHPWVLSHPEYFVHGDEESLGREPQNFFRAETVSGWKILAHGRDPYFPGWSDTAQLDYRYRGLRTAMQEVLVEVAGQCDGVRCDMAMLVLQDVFARTWGEPGRSMDIDTPAPEGEFWEEAIDAVRARFPDFIFIAEAYWGLERELQALGFNYTYDKLLYDRLVHKRGTEVHEHLRVNAEVHARSTHFLENHDELRAAQAFSWNRHRAAALTCFAIPGMRLFHEGQLDGRKIRIPVQLARRPREPRDQQIRGFYQKLLVKLQTPVFRCGGWKLLETRPAWPGNDSWRDFVIHRWERDGKDLRLVVVNFAPDQGQCYVPLDFSGLNGRKVLLTDLFSDASYQREGDSLQDPGLYLDMAPFQLHLFALTFLDLQTAGTLRRILPSVGCLFGCHSCMLEAGIHKWNGGYRNVVKPGCEPIPCKGNMTS
jgi:glycosidase